ncbi:zinc metallochaperone AztD [Arthrobacter globiformis]|uniref:zinc metallochaperone AztD n=1 Tax=Arthrobacter globiformis TaxID=1665 RepID=UPI0027D9090C|nr:zinc metallochaperone AztD [Arthrobacter globiformis]
MSTKPLTVAFKRPLAAPLVAQVAAACGAALLLSGCAAGPAQSSAERSAGPSLHAKTAQPTELRAPEPRLVYTYAGGIGVLDAATLEPVGDVAVDGYNRISPAGDGRHVLVAAGESFRVLDAGIWTEQHGDHGHSYAAEPTLTDHAFEASKPGHVVRHAGRTVLFSDGSGKVESFESAALGALADDGLPQTSTYTAPEAHHGVAVELDDGRLLVTVGDEDARNAVALLGQAAGQDRKEILRSQNCPGVHGEAVAGENTVIFGCEDGMLVFEDGKFAKVSSPDAYGRMGNQAGSPASPVVLGDYKVDKDAVLERPTRISLVNTGTKALKLVELGTSYSFRSLGRGPAGEALVLGTDGALHVLNPLTGATVSTVPVVPAWQEPEAWQDPRPTLYVQGSTAYVTEPAARKLHAVDLKTGKTVRTATLAHAPDELTGVTG